MKTNVVSDYFVCFVMVFSSCDIDGWLSGKPPEASIPMRFMLLLRILVAILLCGNMFSGDENGERDPAKRTPDTFKSLNTLEWHRDCSVFLMSPSATRYQHNADMIRPLNLQL